MKTTTALLLAAALPFAASAETKRFFSKDNLVAWCVVPFDAMKRGPEERARMLKNLGFTMLAYDWRDKDIPTFDAEIDALNRQGIKLQAFWLTSGPEPATEKSVSTVLGFLERRRVKTQLWYMFVPPKNFAALSQEDKLVMASSAANYVAAEADRIGCSVGLYNHGGWFGEPENQLAILARVGRKNVGLVYNFHHGREQMDRFAEFFPKLVPRLLAVNLNGMKNDGPLILTLGEGDRELEMLTVVRDSGYRGPIGILGHRAEQDVELSLRQNLEGLEKLARALERE